MNKDKVKQLGAPLPEWAVTQHPTKKFLSVIDPMAVIDRLNEVFGVGGWKYETESVSYSISDGASTGFAVVKGVFTVPQHDIHLEQFGGNDNKDVGDAYKGASTDALTKIASYLGIGASIYRGQGNVGNVEPMTLEEAFAKLATGKTPEEVRAIYATLPKNLQADDEVKAKGKEVVEGLEEILNNK